MNEEHGVGIRQGCKAVSLARSTYRYKPKPNNDEPTIPAMAMFSQIAVHLPEPPIRVRFCQRRKCFNDGNIIAWFAPVVVPRSTQPNKCAGQPYTQAMLAQMINAFSFLCRV